MNHIKAKRYGMKKYILVFSVFVWPTLFGMRRRLITASITRASRPIFQIQKTRAFLATKTEAKSRKGETALHAAVRSGEIETIQRILPDGEIDYNEENSEGQTPLDLAREYRNSDIEDLLQRWPAAANRESLG